MHIYLLSLVFVILTSLLKNKKYQVVLNGGILFVISSLRDITVGSDLVNYISYFKIISNLNFSELSNIKLEYGYVLFNKIISVIFNNERFFIISVSFFIIILFSKFIYDNSKNPWLSFFLFITLMYYALTLNQIRQMMAAAIVLFNINSVKDKKKVKFFSSVLIATLFHKTAIVYIILYFIKNIKIDYKYILGMFILSIGVFLFGDRMVINLMQLINKYQIYSNNVISNDGTGMLILLIIITFLGWIFYEDDDKRKSIYFHIMFVSILIQIISLKFSILNRITNYFSIIMIILIPNVIKSRTEIYMRCIGTIILCIITSVFFIYSLKLDFNGIVPYSILKM